MGTVAESSLGAKLARWTADGSRLSQSVAQLDQPTSVSGPQEPARFEHPSSASNRVPRLGVSLPPRQTLEYRHQLILRVVVSGED